MNYSTFSARLAWCREGSWGQTREQALEKCVILTKNVLEMATNSKGDSKKTAEQIQKIADKIENINPGIRETVLTDRLHEVLEDMKNMEQPLALKIATLQIVHDMANLEDTVPDARVEAQSQDRACVVCLTYEKTHAFMPCGHLCVCEECGMRAFEESHACPVCRAVATECRVIFS